MEGKKKQRLPQPTPLPNFPLNPWATIKLLLPTATS